jgi:hypothetical protein
VRLMAEKGGSETCFCSECFGLSLSVSFRQRSVFVYMLLLPESQTGETWASSKISALSEIGEHWAEGISTSFLNGLYSVNYSDVPLNVIHSGPETPDCF